MSDEWRAREQKRKVRELARQRDILRVVKQFERYTRNRIEELRVDLRKRPPSTRV